MLVPKADVLSLKQCAAVSITVGDSKCPRAREDAVVLVPDVGMSLPSGAPLVTAAAGAVHAKHAMMLKTSTDTKRRMAPAFPSDGTASLVMGGYARQCEMHTQSRWLSAAVGVVKPNVNLHALLATGVNAEVYREIVGVHVTSAEDGRRVGPGNSAGGHQNRSRRAEPKTRTREAGGEPFA